MGGKGGLATWHSPRDQVSFESDMIRTGHSPISSFGSFPVLFRNFPTTSLNLNHLSWFYDFDFASNTVSNRGVHLSRCVGRCMHGKVQAKTQWRRLLLLLLLLQWTAEAGSHATPTNYLKEVPPLDAIS